jgi:hypothetical protein
MRSNGDPRSCSAALVGIPDREANFPRLSNSYKLADQPGLLKNLQDCYFLYSFYKVPTQMAYLMFACGLSPFTFTDTASGCVVADITLIPPEIMSKFHLAGVLDTATSERSLSLYIDDLQRFIIVDNKHRDTDIRPTRHLAKSEGNQLYDLISYVQMTLIPNGCPEGLQLLSPHSDRVAYRGPENVICRTSPLGPTPTGETTLHYYKTEHAYLTELTSDLTPDSPWLNKTEEEASTLSSSVMQLDVMEDRLRRFNYLNYLRIREDNSVVDLTGLAKTMYKVMSGPLMNPGLTAELEHFIKSFCAANVEGTEVLELLETMVGSMVLRGPEIFKGLVDNVDDPYLRRSNQKGITNMHRVLKREREIITSISHLANPEKNTELALRRWKHKPVKTIYSAYRDGRTRLFNELSTEETQALLLLDTASSPRHLDMRRPNSLRSLGDSVLDTAERVPLDGSVTFWVVAEGRKDYETSALKELEEVLMGLTMELGLTFVPILLGSPKSIPSDPNEIVQQTVFTDAAVISQISRLVGSCPDMSQIYAHLITEQPGSGGLSSSELEHAMTLIKDPVKLMLSLIIYALVRDSSSYQIELWVHRNI